MTWAVEVLDAARKEIAALPEDMQASFLRVAELLEASGPHRVGMPLVRHLDGALWEMRLRGRDGIARAIYFSADARRLIVVRAFVKKTQKTPPDELKLAAKRMKGWIDAQNG
jgi:phage-related protein